MKLSRLFIVNAMVNAVYGLAFAAIPVPLLELYGVSLNPGSALVARLFGGAIIAIGLILWRLRSSPREVAQLVVLPLFIADALGFVTYVMAMLAGSVNVLGWGVVFISGVLAIGYGYFAFVKPR